jgi:hypothetical protein
MGVQAFIVSQTFFLPFFFTLSIMSFLDDDIVEDSLLPGIEPIKPVQVSLSDAARLKSGRSIPPDVLIRIFQYLPVPSLAKVAMASRRFKVLAYDDEIWDTKLRIMLENDTGALAAMLGNIETFLFIYFISSKLFFC